VLGKQALHLGDEGVPTGTRSGFRLRAPAALTPAKRLNFAALRMTKWNITKMTR
jgi:hypothetical protein